MTTPIKPSDAIVDRECERRWIEQINAKLAEPWSGDEVRRIIEVEGKMSSYSQLVRWVQDQYLGAGWYVTVESAFSAPDRYAALIFTRPYEGASQ